MVVGRLIPPQKCNQCILQHHLTGQSKALLTLTINISSIKIHKAYRPILLYLPVCQLCTNLPVCQLCTNPKSDRSLLSCLKVTQCSTSKIREAPLYKSCSLSIQVMTTGRLPSPSKCKSGLPRIARTCPGWWIQSFRLRLWSLVWFQVRATSCHHTFSMSAWKSNVCTKECGDPLVQSGGRWQTLGVAAGLGAGPQVQRDPGLASEGVLWLCTLLPLAPTSSSDLNSLDDFVWSYVENITNMTSHNTKPAWSPLSAENSPSSRQRLWKRHALSSGSVSRRWLRLKAATLNRCQLYYIIKLPELIFSIKVLEWSCTVVFFRTTILSFHPVLSFVWKRCFFFLWWLSAAIFKSNTFSMDFDQGVLITF